MDRRDFLRCVGAAAAASVLTRAAVVVAVNGGGAGDAVRAVFEAVKACEAGFGE